MPKYAAWPNDVMPPVPIRNCRLRREQRGDEDVGREHQRVVVAGERQAAPPATTSTTSAPIAAGRCRGARRARARPARGVVVERGRSAEQTVRRHDQHDRHHDELRDQRQLGKGDRRCRRRRPCRAAMHSALMTPISSAASERARDRAETADDGDDERLGDDREIHAEIGRLRGSCSAPARPARNDPARTPPVNSRASSMPSAAVSSRFSVAARTSMPKRVRAHEPRQREQHDGSDADQEEIVGRDGAAEDRRPRRRARRRAGRGGPRGPRSRAPRRGRSARCRRSP